MPFLHNMTLIAAVAGSWEDGEPVKSCLEAPDRWQVQAAERVTVEINPEQLVIVQQQVVSQPFLKLRRLTALKRSS